MMRFSSSRLLAKLMPWHRRKAEKFSHRNALIRLRDLGFAPRTVYDIGANRAGWTKLTAEVFPQAEPILFEANADNAPALAGHRHVIAALAAEDGMPMAFHVPREGDSTGASLYRENTAHYADANLAVRMVETARLDTLAERHGFPAPDLIKIDVQGAELDVMAGGPKAFAAADALIVEVSLLDYNAGAPLFAPVVAAVDGLGFRGVDICEIHRAATGTVLQIDLLFAKPSLFARYGAQAGLTT